MRNNEINGGFITTSLLRISVGLPEGPGRNFPTAPGRRQYTPRSPLSRTEPAAPLHLAVIL
jgi:hypothetical protein